MKITFEETLSRKEWLHKELLLSLTPEIIEKAQEDRFYEVKLLVNGIELEPSLFNDIISNIDKYIEREAERMVMDKFESADLKARELIQLIESAKRNVADKFGIDEEDY
jgi:hypothetical protein